MVHSLDPSLPMTSLHSADHSISSVDVGDAFVDDTKVGCTSTYVHDERVSLQENLMRAEADAIAKLGVLSQQWERLLFATGGALCLAKSFWYLLSWRWSKSGKAYPATVALAPGRLLLTAGTNATPVKVPRIESTSSFRTLGARISPAGKSDLAISVLRSQSIDFATRVASSKLSREATYWAFWQFYTPKVGFSLPTLHLTQAECKRIQSPAICATLSKLHFNHCTSRAIVFGPTKYAGLDLPHLATTENVGQLRLLLGHLRLQDKTADLILIDISYIQLLVGSSTTFFNLPYDKYKWLVDDCWLTSIWAFLSM
jgi:hypothetical protein